MRTPKYLSPTSIMKFYKEPEQFYIDYLAEAKPPRMPQTLPMSVGSAFDAYVKSALHEALFGVGADPRFEFTTIFETQVESQNRTWALAAGKHAYEVYLECGAYADLLSDLLQAQGSPRFESEVLGNVGDDVPLLGKMDCYFVNKDGHPIILDWKVNGYCSKSLVSPKKGYVRLRDGIDIKCHKEVVFGQVGGVTINMAHPLEVVDGDWATQLAIYSWLCGEIVGSEFVCAVDQLACGPSGIPDKPKIRVAQHRAVISSDFQNGLLKSINTVWGQIKSGHIFGHLSFQENVQKCKALEVRAQQLCGATGIELELARYSNWK